MQRRDIWENVWGGLAQTTMFLDASVYQLLLAFLLGAHQYGEVAIVLAASHLGVTFIDVGSNYVLVDVLSSGNGAGGPDRAAREEATRVWLLKMTLAAGVAVSGYLVIGPVAAFYGISVGAMSAAPLLLVLSAWHLGGNAIGNATHRNNQVLRVQVVFAAVHSGLPVLLAVTGNLSVTAVLWAAVAARFAGALLVSPMLPQVLVFSNLHGVFRAGMLRKFFSFGMPAWSNAFFGLGIPLVVGRVISTEAAGYVRLATAIVRGITNMLPISQNMVLVTVRRYSGPGERRPLLRYLGVLGGIAVLVSAVVGIGLLTAGNFAFQKIYGLRYEPVMPMVMMMFWAILPAVLKKILDSTNLALIPAWQMVSLHAGTVAIGFLLTAWATSLAGMYGAIYVYIGMIWVLVGTSLWLLSAPLRRILLQAEEPA